MDRDGPSKTERDLGDSSLHLPSLFDRPLSIISDDLRPIMELHDRKSLVSPSDMTDRAIGISGFEIIFDEHHSCTDL